MIRKNFIRREFLTPFIEEQKVNLINRLLLVITVILFIFVTFNFIYTLSTKGHLRKTQAKLENMNALAEKVEKVKNDNEIAISLLNTMNSHLSKDLLVLRQLTELASNDNDKLWVEELYIVRGQKDSDTIYRIECQGYAYNLDVMTGFLNSLKKSHEFDSVELIQSRKEKVDDEIMTAFKVIIRRASEK